MVVDFECYIQLLALPQWNNHQAKLLASNNMQSSSAPSPTNGHRRFVFQQMIMSAPSPACPPSSTGSSMASATAVPSAASPLDHHYNSSSLAMNTGIDHNTGPLNRGDEGRAAMRSTKAMAAEAEGTGNPRLSHPLPQR